MQLPVSAQCLPHSISSEGGHFSTPLSMNHLDIGSNKPLMTEQSEIEPVSAEKKQAEGTTTVVVETGWNLATETATELATAQRVQALKDLFDRDVGRGSQPGPRTPIRRTKSVGQVRMAEEPSVVPEVSIDATMNDRLWIKLDPGSHRDSVSSSSSISSNDTVIDLSLPNLARKSLTCLRAAARDCPDSQAPKAGWVSRPRSATTTCVSKSKSNPNLHDGELCEPADELQPRPLSSEHDATRLMQRRHTWSRLYIEGLKQSSASAKRLPAPLLSKDVDSGSKSKSLGDLTSDDIVCNFDSKYRSISRSFITRPTRQQRAQKKEPQDDLTERLKQLTDVEPLTSSDFTSQRNVSEAGPDETEEEEMPPLRRSSSRSQSRVRYIANRARQAQERQRLQGLLRSSGSPIEERGIPEGACSVAGSPCASLDLLSQLPPGPPHQSPLSPDNEVFFMLRL